MHQFHLNLLPSFKKKKKENLLLKQHNLVFQYLEPDNI